MVFYGNTQPVIYEKGGIMNIKIQNRTRMFQATLGYLTKTPGVIKLLVPLIVTATSAFETIVNSILLAIAAADAVSEGTTVSKKESREALFTAADSVARAIIAFAGSTDNTKLATDLQKKIERLDRIGETMFVSRCKDIKKAAEENLPSLVSVGVTQAVIDLLDTLLETYIFIKDEGRQITSDKEAALANLYSLMKDATKLLKQQLDPLVYSLQGQRVYVDAYRVNRKILDLGHKFTTFKGEAKIKDSEIVLTNVQLEFLNSKGEIFTNSTDENGKYRERINPDTYKITAIHPQMQPFVIDGVKILPGELKVENLEMSPKIP